MRVRLILSIVAMTAVLTLGVGIPARGQSDSDQQQRLSPSTQKQKAEISDQDIHAFANAASEVQRVKAKWILTITRQPNAAAQQKAEEQATSEMVGAVQKNGLSVDKYNQIAEIAQADPDFQREIEKNLQQNEQLDEQPGDQPDGP
jgi:hypothetical protein